MRRQYSTASQGRRARLADGGGWTSPRPCSTAGESTGRDRGPRRSTRSSHPARRRGARLGGRRDAGRQAHPRPGYGVADLEHAVPITPGDGFPCRVALQAVHGLCRPLLAADRQAVARGRVGGHVPDMPAFGARITLRHLLHHTSGLRDQWPLLRLAGWREMDERTEDDVLEVVRRQRELNFEPGEAFPYCNTGYTLLARRREAGQRQSLRRFAEQADLRAARHDGHALRDDHTSWSRAARTATREAPPPFGSGCPTSTWSARRACTPRSRISCDGPAPAGAAGGRRGRRRLLRPGTLNDGRSVTAPASRSASIAG